MTGIHQIALQAGVSPALARLYPLMFDAMLSSPAPPCWPCAPRAGATKIYVWVCLLLVLAAVAVGDALHATGVHLTGQAARAAIAVIPWVLLLMGFGIWLVMLRHWRRSRAAGGRQRRGHRRRSHGYAARRHGHRPDRAGAATGTVVPQPGSPTGPRGRAVLTVAGHVRRRGRRRRGHLGGPRGATPAAPGPRVWGSTTLMEQHAGQAPERASAAENAAAGKPAVRREQPRTATPDRGQPAAAGTTGKAGATPAATGTGTGQNGATPGTNTTTGAATTGTATPRTNTTAGAAGPGRTRRWRPARLGRRGWGCRFQDGRSARTGKDGNGKDGNGKESTDQDNGGKDKAEAQDRRTRLGGLREIPVSAGMTRKDPSAPARPAQGPGAGCGFREGRREDAQARRETPDATGDADPRPPTTDPDPPMPAAALAPHFDRLRSSPDTARGNGADGE